MKADLPGASGLRAGLFARLLVPGVAADPRLTVPAAALFERGGLTGLFVVSDGRARLRWVAAGARDGDTRRGPGRRRGRASASSSTRPASRTAPPVDERDRRA